MTDHREHSLTPSRELVQQWVDIWHKVKVKHVHIDVFVATQAANWGADKQLERDAEWLNQNALNEAHLKIMPVGESLKEAMRSPAPSKLKRKALEEVAGAVAGGNITPERGTYIRRALELIPDNL